MPRATKRFNIIAKRVRYYHHRKRLTFDCDIAVIDTTNDEEHDGSCSFCWNDNEITYDGWTGRQYRCATSTFNYDFCMSMKSISRIEWKLLLGDILTAVKARLASIDAVPVIDGMVPASEQLTFIMSIGHDLVKDARVAYRTVSRAGHIITWRGFHGTDDDGNYYDILDHGYFTHNAFLNWTMNGSPHREDGPDTVYRDPGRNQDMINEAGDYAVINT